MISSGAERFRFKAMGCPCELHLYAATRRQAQRIADEAIAETLRLEHKYSRFREDSLASAINRSAGDGDGIEVDAETSALLDYADTCHRESGGRFDISSGVLRRVWNFKARRVPSRAEIAEVLKRVGWQRVRWERPRLVLPVAGMELDFGGYVKEYAADRLAEQVRAGGIAHGLIDLGGDLAVVGPHPDGSPWRVGIRHPRAPERAIARIDLSHGGIATSGDFERFMLVDGKRYTHVLDPRTGWPVEGLASVSVVAQHCLVAGSASTIALLLGPREGSSWLDELGLPSLRVSTDGRVSGALAPGANRAHGPVAASGA